MSAAKHTPGPWEAQRLDANTHEEMIKYIDGTIRMGGSRYFMVGGTHDDGKPADVCHTGNGPRSEANAKLIAAAPVLADALEDAAKHCAALHGAKYREHNCGTCTKWLFALNAAGRLP